MAVRVSGRPPFWEVFMTYSKFSSLCLSVFGLGLILGGAVLVAPAQAELAAGDEITSANMEKAGDQLTPGLKWILGRGMRMRIIDSVPVPLPKAFKEATEQYSGQVKMAADGLSVENYVAGHPFPNIDTNDPEVAKKIMYNFERHWTDTDDLDLTNFDADTGSIGRDGEPLSVEKHFVIDHFRRLYFTGRLRVDPKPIFEPNKDQAHYKESLHPIIEPFDLKGTGFTYYRYLDPQRHDDSWLYLPQLRRVRRLSSAQRSDALFGQDTDIDSYYGYAGSVAWMDWKFLGEKTVLGAFHAENWPVKWGTGSADFIFDDVWEPREVYVVEGISKLPQYAYSKRVIFVDKESFVIPHSDIYDSAGELWKIWVNLYRMRKSPYDAAPPEGHYEDVMAFAPSIAMVDTQLDHATRAALPSQRFGQAVGWSYNKGEESGTDEDFFSVSALISGGR
jgi:hypothetical protein